jgi:hypothetical protein
MNWIGLRFLDIWFELLLEGSDLGCSSKNYESWGDLFFTHGSEIYKVDRVRQRDTIGFHNFVGIWKHRFFMFLNFDFYLWNYKKIIWFNYE